MDVITTEYIEHEMVASGDVTRDGSLMPTEVNTLVKGRLHLRLGNVGYPLDAKLSKTSKFIKTFLPFLVSINVIW